MASFVHIDNLDSALDVIQTMEAFEDAPFVVLFDSAARHRERDARYTFLTADPIAVTRLIRSASGVASAHWYKPLPMPQYILHLIFCANGKHGFRCFRTKLLSSFHPFVVESPA